jgi:hypothetical protein
MPKYLTKRYLVTENQYRSLFDKSEKSAKTASPKLNHPNSEKVQKLKRKMDKDNQDPSMSDFDKVLSYTSDLANYLQNVTKSLTLPKARAILGKRSKPVKERNPEEQAPPRVEAPPETPENPRNPFETPEATPAAAPVRNSSTIP